MWFDQAKAEDLNFLAQYGVWGGVPTVPVSLPGLGRYGRYQFDRLLLLQRNDLTVAQRRELVFLSAHFHKLDHFEFFELKADADDRHLNLGGFTEHVKVVFEYGQQAHKLLMEDTPFRAAYTRVTQARDEVFLQQLQAKRQKQQAQLDLTRAKGIKPPSHQGVVSKPMIPTKTAQRSQEEIDQRKAMLRERLAQNTDRRQNHEQAKQSADIKSQARTFFLAGEQAERRGQLNRALNHFKLCVDYLPKEAKYREAFARIKSQINETKAQELWEQVDQIQSTNDQMQQQYAFDLMLEACELSPNERRLLMLAQTAIEFEMTDRALPVLLKEQKKEPMNLEYMWALIQISEVMKDIDEAKKYADLMLSFDPSEPRALRFKKRYR